MAATFVVTASLTVAFLPRPAAADQVGDLKVKARTIAQDLVQEQLQVDASQQRYAVATQKVSADAGSLSGIGQQLAQDQQEVDHETSTVRELAVRSYMSGGQDLSGSGILGFTGNGETDQAVSEYSSIAAGNMEAALNQLHADELVLQARQAALRQVQAQDQADQAQRAAALGQADGTEQRLLSLQGEVTGQLAVAVAEQDAVQQAAAAAAVAAARTPTTPAAAATPDAPAPAAAPALLSDPPLPPYLRCVVLAESGGDYGAVSPGGTYMGAFQFSQSTWNTAARAAGLPSLVGVPPNRASRAEQDVVAITLYELDGRQPWLGDRCA